MFRMYLMGNLFALGVEMDDKSIMVQFHKGDERVPAIYRNMEELKNTEVVKEVNDGITTIIAIEWSEEY